MHKNLKISAKVSEDYTTQKETTQVVCNVFAIQRANLEPQKAINLMPTGLVNVVYKNWAIAYSTGNVYEHTQYFATSAYISVDGFEKISSDTNYRPTFYCYDSQFKYLGSGGGTTKNNILEFCPNAKYFGVEIPRSETKTLEECLKESGIKLYGNCEVVERTL